MSIKKSKVGYNSLTNLTESPLTVSKSGRVIKPRLHKWEGERISYDVYGNPIAAYSSITKEPNNPNCSAKLTTLSYAIGTRLESSKQEYRRSGAYLLPNYVPKIKNRKKKNEKLVDYSSSESDDSLFNIVDQIPLSDEEANNKKIVKYVVEEPPDSDNENKAVKSLLPNKNNDSREEQGFYSDPESTSNLIKKTSNKQIIQSVKDLNKKTFNQKLLNTNNWTKDEIKRLWFALKATKNLSLYIDWNMIACLISGGVHNGEECKNFAIENGLLLINKSNVYVNENFFTLTSKEKVKRNSNESFVNNVGQVLNFIKTSGNFAKTNHRHSAALQIKDSYSENMPKSKKSEKKLEKKNVVNYSQSESEDSFLQGIDSFVFSDNETNKNNNKSIVSFTKNNSLLRKKKIDKSIDLSTNKDHSDLELTPIPLKRAPHRRIIKSDKRPSQKSEYKKLKNDFKIDSKRITPKRKASSKFKLKEPKKKKKRRNTLP